MRVLRNYLSLSFKILAYTTTAILVGLFIVGVISSLGKGI